jgi:hypothetical protein
MKKNHVVVAAIAVLLAFSGVFVVFSMRGSKVQVPREDICLGEREVTDGSITYTSCYAEPLEEVLPLVQKQLDGGWKKRPGKNPDVVVFVKDHLLFGPFFLITLRRKEAKWPFANPKSEQEYKTVVEAISMNIVPW